MISMEGINSSKELWNKIEVKRSDIIYKNMKSPAFMRYYYKMQTISTINGIEFAGSSPTDLFIGRYGYPKVYIGPLLPPEFGDTSILATPERWTGMPIENVVDMRTKLIRGMHLTNIYDVEKGKIEYQIAELAMADKPADADMQLSSKPFAKMEFKDEIQPFGPSAKIKGFDLYNTKADQKIESMHYDYDAKASTAMIELYAKGINVSKIQRGVSAGLFGIKNNRKFVPTRWSITAVDDTLSKNNLKEVKQCEPIDAIRIYYSVALDNRWIIIMMPGNWQYESIEAWYPNTAWNEGNGYISIYSSYEPYDGRSKYAEIGGCYYAARLAVSEKLRQLQKQAAVLILREVHDGYTMPVGVWNVREHVREALKSEPIVISGLAETINFIKSKLDISLPVWTKNSTILRDLLFQRRIN